MLYNEFVKDYCKDITTYVQSSRTVDDDGLDINFYYEDIITDNDGRDSKVVYTEDQRRIPINDIITNYPEDFLRLHPNDLETYNRYMDMYEEETGIAAILAIREKVKKEMDRVENEANIHMERFFG